MFMRHRGEGRAGLLALSAICALLAALPATAAAVAPSNDDFANAITLAGPLPMTDTGTNAEATGRRASPGTASKARRSRLRSGGSGRRAQLRP